jgi:hypothetical protein
VEASSTPALQGVPNAGVQEEAWICALPLVASSDNARSGAKANLLAVANECTFLSLINMWFCIKANLPTLWHHLKIAM